VEEARTLARSGAGRAALRLEPLLTAMANWKREVFNVIEFPFDTVLAERMNRDVKKL
jgi:hypothetical protein